MTRFAVPCAVLAMAAAACAPKARTTFEAKPQALDALTCIAVLPFENLSEENPGAGDAFADLFATELMRTGRFQVMDRAESARILASRGIYLGATIDAETARALGEVLGVQAVAVGAVSEYGYTPGTRDRAPRPMVGVTTRLVDVKDGSALWGTTFAGSPTSFFDDATAPMHLAAQRVASDVSASLVSSAGAVRGLPGETCWEKRAQSVLATLAPGQPGRPGTPAPTPVPTAVAVALSTPAPTPAPTPVAVARPSRPPLTAPQAALKEKMKPQAQFVLDGIVYNGPRGAKLAPPSNRPLADLAAVLLSHPEARIRVEAHVDPTDPAPVPVSQKRAEAIVSKLQELGVPSGQVEPKGMGGSKSLFPSFVEAMKAKNRRVELLVLAAPSEDASGGTPTGAAPAVAAATDAQVKVLASKGRTAQAVRLANELKQSGSNIVKIAAVAKHRTSTLVYFTAPHRAEAQRLADSIPVPGGAKVAQYKNLGRGVDIVIVVGSDLK